jgi:hypothetical protein
MSYDPDRAHERYLRRRRYYQEYRERNQRKIARYQKAYYETHSETIKETARQHRLRRRRGAAGNRSRTTTVQGPVRAVLPVTDGGTRNNPSEPRARRVRDFQPGDAVQPAPPASSRRRPAPVGRTTTRSARKSTEDSE